MKRKSRVRDHNAKPPTIPKTKGTGMQEGEASMKQSGEGGNLRGGCHVNSTPGQCVRWEHRDIVRSHLMTKGGLSGGTVGGPRHGGDCGAESGPEPRSEPDGLHLDLGDGDTE